MSFNKKGQLWATHSIYYLLHITFNNYQYISQSMLFFKQYNIQPSPIFIYMDHFQNHDYNMYV